MPCTLTSRYVFSNLPLQKPFTAMSSLASLYFGTHVVLSKRRLPIIMNNEIRDITATLLTEVCNGVCVEEPEQQEVTKGKQTGRAAT